MRDREATRGGPNIVSLPCCPKTAAHREKSLDRACSVDEHGHSTDDSLALGSPCRLTVVGRTSGVGRRSPAPPFQPAGKIHEFGSATSRPKGSRCQGPSLGLTFPLPAVLVQGTVLSHSRHSSAFLTSIRQPRPMALLSVHCQGGGGSSPLDRASRSTSAPAGNPCRPGAGDQHRSALASGWAGLGCVLWRTAPVH